MVLGLPFVRVLWYASTQSENPLLLAILSASSLMICSLWSLAGHGSEHIISSQRAGRKSGEMECWCCESLTTDLLPLARLQFSLHSGQSARAPIVQPTARREIIGNALQR